MKVALPLAGVGFPSVRLGDDMRELVLKLGAAIIILGVFGIVISSGLPDGVLIVIGFAVAVVAVGVGLRVRGDGSQDREG